MKKKLYLITTITTITTITLLIYTIMNICSVFNNKQITIIAHASGIIDKKIYTNSLDALNISYQQGARILELDILTTSDGHYVATHDWPLWKQQTGFTGPLPPTLNEFNNHLILNKYTPLDMYKINHWFKIHSDAILITDKVNDPINFINQFTDPNRVYMELFSLQAIQVASANNLSNIIWANFYTTIAPIPNHALAEFITQYNIQNIVIGTPKNKEELDKLNLLKKYGVKINMYLSRVKTEEETLRQIKLHQLYIDRVYSDFINCKEFRCTL